MNGKLLLGTVGAIAGALLGAIIWAAISASTDFRIGWMAVGVGFLAGYGMRTLGGGRDRADGTVAAVVAFLGCVLGNVLTAAVEVAQQNHYPIAATIIVTLLKPAIMVDLLGLSFRPMDLLFYAIAIYTGYRTALKPPARAASVTATAPAAPQPVAPQAAEPQPATSDTTT